VSGGDEVPARDVTKEQVQLIPDKKDYTPGNTAEILIQAPFSPSEGIVTWRRSGIIKTERIHARRPDQGDHRADHRRDDAEPVRPRRFSSAPPCAPMIAASPDPRLPEAARVRQRRAPARASHRGNAR